MTLEPQAITPSAYWFEAVTTTVNDLSDEAHGHPTVAVEETPAGWRVTVQPPQTTPTTPAGPSS